MLIKDLKGKKGYEGRVYRCVIRRLRMDFGYKMSNEEILELSLKDVLDMYTDGELAKARLMGPKTLEALKELA